MAGMGEGATTFTAGISEQDSHGSRRRMGGAVLLVSGSAPAKRRGLFGSRWPSWWGSACQGVVFALHASFMPELFGTDARYSGVSLGFQLGATIGGGLTPVTAAAILARTGASWAISLILVGSAS